LRYTGVIGGTFLMMGKWPVRMTTVNIRTISDSSLVGSAGPRTVTIDRAKGTGGYSGAIAGCYSDIFRKAGKRGISARKLQVTVRADCSGEPVRVQTVSFDVAVEADADLIQHTDRVAEIRNSLYFGTAVKLAELKAIPLR
jgi:hypothetical protein